LNELAAALGDDANFSTTITNSIASKAPLSGPTFTGTVVTDNITISGDASLNGRVDICGNFYAQYPDGSIPASAVIGGGGGIDTNLDLSLNGRVDICGNFYAQYPDGSIPASAVIGGGGGIDTNIDLSLNAGLNVVGGVTFNSGATISGGLTIANEATDEIILQANEEWTSMGSTLLGVNQGDGFGDTVAMSGDGSTIAVSIYSDDTNITDGGSVKIYKYINNNWSEIGAFNSETELHDSQIYFHSFIDLNQDGTIFAYGVSKKSYNNVPSVGIVKVFEYNSDLNTWSQKGNTLHGTYDYTSLFGTNVTLNDAGNIMAVGAPNYKNQLGYIAVYQYDGSLWIQLGSNFTDYTTLGKYVGWSITLNSAGNILGFSAAGTSGKAGKIFMYEYSNNVWSLLGSPVNRLSYYGNFGNGLHLDGVGHTIVVGEPELMINGGQYTGAVYVYQYDQSSNSWNQQTVFYGNHAYQRMGNQVSINKNGTIFSVSSHGTSSTNINGAGFVNVYQLINNVWVFIGEKNGLSAYDGVGISIDMNDDGNKLVVGELWTDANANNAGSVRTYSLPFSGGVKPSGKLFVESDVSFNSNLYIGGDTVFSGSVTGISATSVGLGNVDNTSDINKPISTVTQSALDLKPNASSPTFTGIPNAPTANAGTTTTQIATTAFVQSAVSNLVDSAPGALNTLNELAAALGDDASFSTTITNSIASKAPLSGPIFTGTVVTDNITISGDASLNGRVDVCGNFYAQYPVGSIPISALLGEVGIDTESDLSLNAGFSVAGDASFNGEVDICGNFRAQYPDQSIPRNALVGDNSVGVYIAKEITYDDSDFTLIKEDTVAYNPITNYGIFLPNAGTYDEDGFALIKEHPATPTIVNNIKWDGRFELLGSLTANDTDLGLETSNEHINSGLFKQFDI